MKKFFEITLSLVIIVSLGSVAYSFKNKFSSRPSLILEDLKSEVGTILGKSPCSEPIPYKIGTFDTRFGISKDYFISALSDAEAVWEKPLGKNFFVYSPNDTSPDAMKINLVYDSRQEATSELKSLGIVVQDNKASYNNLKLQLSSLKTKYDGEKTAFDAETNSFNQKEKVYETEVNYWNAKGGAPESEYNKINAERSALQTESANLQTTEKELNGEVDEINAMVVSLNHLVSVLNLSVDNYNATVGSSPGESFEEGVYISDGTSKQINIYEFSNRTKLVRALAHELGHALGLEHVDDPDAIMYKLNENNSLTLTQADISELKTKCNFK